ncbi:MAG: UDP-N-acetylmuramoyl-L-alanine--D-glutamate ligase, partial [Chloroflexi bacterium]|nr:UDP-N-acetylmuramoyl-L-alanine--D-glutamate ligase [Chloroflexota bacterium]
MRVTIFGLGRREGVSLVHFLHHRGAHILVSDQQPAERLTCQLQDIADIPVELDLGGHSPTRILEWSDVIFVSPVIRRDHPILVEAKNRGICISSETELFFAENTLPVTGVTGSAGKTTTASLISRMLQQDGVPHLLGGNIGRPVLGKLSQLQQYRRVVLELSSFQLEPLRASLNVAVVTNITPNHLDRHGTMEAYVEAKRHIVTHQATSDWAVLNADDATVSSFATSTAAQLGWFSLSPRVAKERCAAYVDHDTLVLRLDEREVPLVASHELILRGSHNVANALAASLAAYVSGVSLDAIRQTLCTFAGVPHRLELVAEYRGVRYYNDSIATAPERVIAAIRSFQEPLIVILTGRDKHLPWESA